MMAPASTPATLCVPVSRESDVAHVIVLARRFCSTLALPPLAGACVATAASELANNLWMHSTRGGTITLSTRQSVRGRGVQLESRDEGPGIPDLALAMREGYSTGGGLGCGLPGVQRLMDDFHIESSPSQGTRVVTCKWERP